MREWLEPFVHGTALTTASQPLGASGNYQHEWGELYLCSEAERRIAEALDQAGV